MIRVSRNSEIIIQDLDKEIALIAHNTQFAPKSRQIFNENRVTLLLAWSVKSVRSIQIKTDMYATKQKTEAVSYILFMHNYF
jgi:hypothetical protein